MGDELAVPNWNKKIAADRQLPLFGKTIPRFMGSAVAKWSNALLEI